MSNKDTQDMKMRLMEAAEWGDMLELELVLLGGQDPDTRYADDGTALHIAARHGHLDVIERLLKAGANPDLQDVVGATALHWAAMLAPTVLLIALLRGGANPSIKDDDGNTPLDWAEREGNEQHARLLRAAMEADREAALEALQRQAQELGFDYY